MQLNQKLFLYSSLAYFPLLQKRYTAKIMVVAFLGTHVPLLALIFNFVTSNSYSWEIAIRVLLNALLATLAGTAATLLALHYLLAPVILTSAALQDYLQTKKLPQLPTKFADEAGTLMADTSQTLYKLDELIHQITNYDNLTGLPNRDLFSDRLYQNVSQSQNQQQLIAVLSLASIKSSCPTFDKLYG
jgi:predicted signal transduction protein with EAL and GGDEF domain